MNYKNLLIANLIILLLFVGIILCGQKKESFVVTGDNINVRHEPTIKGKILYQLRIGNEVILLRKSGKKESIGKIEGEWVFIDTNHFKPGTRETIKGWVIDYYLLSDFSRFKKITDLRFDKCTFEYTIGDSYFYYEFKKDGTYATENKDQYLNKSTGVHKGQLYYYNSLIMAKDVTGQTQALFYINKDGYICDTFFDLQGNSACSKCVVK